MANTLAYYGMATITAVKSFIVQAPGCNLASRKQVNKVAGKCVVKLECSSKSSLFHIY